MMLIILAILFFVSMLTALFVWGYRVIIYFKLKPRIPVLRALQPFPIDKEKFIDKKLASKFNKLLEVQLTLFFIGILIALVIVSIR